MGTPFFHFSPRWGDHFLANVEKRSIYDLQDLFAVLFISNNNKFLCTEGYELFLCLTPTPAFDTIELLVDFIGTINRHIELEQCV